MAGYQVGFDGKWQEGFDDQATAVTWAESVGETGRIVFVVRRRWRMGWPKLVAVFPESRAHEGTAAWDDGAGAAGRFVFTEWEPDPPRVGGSSGTSD